MKIVVTGASGFVGSNIVKVLEGLYGDQVVGDRVDLLDPDAMRAHVAGHAPDGIIHCAIVNDWERILRDRHYGWRGYVESTRTYAEAAANAGIPFVLVSTDWVFDGTQGPADEHTPPNPINIYGFLKAAAEVVTLDREGAVARVSGVNGTHWARSAAPRDQDQGFGYFVTSLVETLEAGQPFTVWESDDINMIASPCLASMCGEIMRVMVADGVSGIAHCCGANAVSRRELAANAVDVFGLDPSLLRFGPPPGAAPMPIPYNTALSASETAKRLDFPLPSIRELLTAMRHERVTGTLTRFVE
jgi:dTDP-4-dehydrorhamnose reductase